MFVVIVMIFVVVFSSLVFLSLFSHPAIKAKRKTIVFGDRFPLRYFVDEYNLKYYAAFPGCSEQTEASSKTISFAFSKF